jgi:hypothetical protein
MADKLIKPSTILAYGLVFLLGCRVEVFVANLPILFFFFSVAVSVSLTQPSFSFFLFSSSLLSRRNSLNLTSLTIL